WQFRTRMPGSAVATTGFSPIRDLRVEEASAETLTAADAEARVIELVNKERTSRGLAPVRLHEDLLDAARAHSSEMAWRGVLTHLSADGSTVTERLIEYGYTQSGYSYWKVGEDIGCGDAETLFGTPEGIVLLWMDSVAHRAVILEPAFRDVGVGVSTSTGGTRYFTLDMGRRIL
ncbi:MAG: CAP domain-containing protein, partial [Thermoleophilia bacterium]|nr:CAP domain-containing protein [Thermoleophilia bacterium]